MSLFMSVAQCSQEEIQERFDRLGVLRQDLVREIEVNNKIMKGFLHEVAQMIRGAPEIGKLLGENNYETFDLANDNWFGEPRLLRLLNSPNSDETQKTLAGNIWITLQDARSKMRNSQLEIYYEAVSEFSQFLIECVCQGKIQRDQEVEIKQKMLLDTAEEYSNTEMIILYGKKQFPNVLGLHARILANAKKRPDEATAAPSQDATAPDQSIT